MARTVYFVEKGAYRNSKPWASNVRGPNGQRFGGSGNDFELSLSPEVSAQFKTGVTNARFIGTQKNRASSGIRKTKMTLRLDTMA